VQAWWTAGGRVRRRAGTGAASNMVADVSRDACGPAPAPFDSILT
jgi:hypothetical protein